MYLCWLSQQLEQHLARRKLKCSVLVASCKQRARENKKLDLKSGKKKETKRSSGSLMSVTKAFCVDPRRAARPLAHQSLLPPARGSNNGSHQKSSNKANVGETENVLLRWNLLPPPPHAHSLILGPPHPHGVSSGGGWRL